MEKRQIDIFIEFLNGFKDFINKNNKTFIDI